MRPGGEIGARGRLAMQDPYSVLGVERSADHKQIKAAYRKLAKKYHPDQRPDDPRAKERFAALGQAYEILGTPERKAQFDRGEIDAEGKPRFSGFEGFSPGGRGRRPGEQFAGGGRAGAEDVLNEFFGAAFGQGARPGSAGPGGFGGANFPGGGFDPSNAGARQRPGKGRDSEITAIVSLGELMAGKTNVDFPSGKKASVTIPPGTRDGQTIRLKGKGAPGPAGTPGDAMVTVKVKAQSGFLIDGDHLRTELPVTLKEAVEGGKKAVKTVEGRVSLTVPPWSSSGRVFRLKGKGLPTKDRGRGDLLITLIIELPENPDPELRSFVKTWNPDLGRR